MNLDANWLWFRRGKTSSDHSNNFRGVGQGVVSNEEDLLEEPTLLQLICSAPGAAGALAPRGGQPVPRAAGRVRFAPVTGFPAELSWSWYWAHRLHQVKKRGLAPTETHQENRALLRSQHHAGIASSFPASINQTRPRFVWQGPPAQNEFCCMDSCQ